MTISLSTAEAEYYSATTATTQLGSNLAGSRASTWVPTFRCSGPTPLFEDSTARIKLRNNAIGGYERAMHIDIRNLDRKHYAHEAIQLGHARLVRVAQATAICAHLPSCASRSLPQRDHHRL
jgi:hypothetical protein